MFVRVVDCEARTCRKCPQTVAASPCRGRLGIRPTPAANASFNSQVSMSRNDNLLRVKSSVADNTGPSP